VYSQDVSSVPIIGAAPRCKGLWWWELFCKGKSHLWWTFETHTWICTTECLASRVASPFETILFCSRLLGKPSHLCDSETKDSWSAAGLQWKQRISIPSWGAENCLETALSIPGVEKSSSDGLESLASYPPHNPSKLLWPIYSKRIAL